MTDTAHNARSRRGVWTWLDLFWLVFLAGLAVLPPVDEIHKQLILLGLAIFQLLESRMLDRWPRRGPAAAVAIKLALSTLLIGHTGQLAINSRYYPIFYIPVVTAAMLFGPWATLGWTALSSAAYSAYLWPALRIYQLDVGGRDELILRVFFFFLLAMIINRFVMDTRRQRDLYRQTAESLAAANRQLLQAQAEARTAERLAALGQMSAGLAHEIRNPLAVIKGSAEMLQQQVQGAGGVAGELAGYISSEVNRVNELVTRFLDFARPLRLEREPVELEALLDRALEEASQSPQARGVLIERDYQPALPRVSLDATLCERAFANLAHNAFEAMAPLDAAIDAAAAAPRRLRIRAFAAGENGQRGIAVEFQDSGPGVPPALREQIFNPFFTTKSSGVGLGLAIVAKIIDQHGGRLSLAAEGAGATFRIFLPLGAAAQAIDSIHAHAADRR